MTKETQDSEEGTMEPQVDQLAGLEKASLLQERRRDFTDPRKKARGYQLEVLDRALEENTIIFLETGCGKTLIAVLLIDALSHLIRKPSLKIAVFLAPNRALVDQQAKEIEEHTNLRVGKYWGSIEGDTWNYTWWRKQIVNFEVIVMTPQILFNNLHHCFFTMAMIELLIFDECHHAQKNHPYANIMRDFYHSQRAHRPKIFGMTASPIIGKVDRGGAQPIGLQMNKLESMLDSTVYTLKDRVELEGLLPNPVEQIRQYEPLYKSDYVESFAKVLRELKDKFLKPEEKRVNPKDALVYKKQMEEVGGAYRSLEYCIYEFGPWCTKKAAELLIEKDAHYIEPGVANPKQAFVQEALSAIKTIISKEESEDPLSPYSTGLSTRLLSSKLLCLIRILLDFRVNFQKGIIFVERVVATKVLSSLISHLPRLSFLRCLPLVGSQFMTQKSQQHTIEKFRSGEVNLLVATNIAEEGLDIQSCFLVIRFDAPNTNRSFIQSRGRARKQGSNYVVLVERGNQEHLDNVRDLKENEKLMWEAAEYREMPVKMEPGNVDVEFYRVESTGAIVTTEYSVPLLNRYCSKLPGDQFYRPKPEFPVYFLPGGVVCEVRLPSTAPVQLVRGHVCSTIKMARRVAALECCKKLHELGALSDYLLPASDLKQSELDESDDPTKPTLKADTMELHPTLIPKALRGQWGDLSSKVRLFAYDFHILAEPQDREYADYALFLEFDLDEDTKATVTELHLTKGRVAKVQLVPTGQVEFDVKELKVAQLYQERIFSIMLDRNTEHKLPLPTPAYWDPRRLYLLLPVVPGASTSSSVDWTSMYDVLSDTCFNVSASGPDLDTQKHIEVKPDGWDCRSPSKSCGFFQMSDGRVPVEAVVNSLVETVYNGNLYCVVDVLWDMNGTSQFECNPSQAGSYIDYIDYFKKRYKLDLVHQKQPLLKAKPLMRIHNLIVKRPDKEPGSASKAEVLVELPPELCSVKVFGFPAKTVNTLSLVPSFMHRLEYMFISTELQQKLKDAFREASKVSPKMVLQAITTATCLETFSLERLELFGDSFLKFAVSKQLFLVYEQLQEGQLTSLRQQVICNSFLHKLGVKNGLPHYIHDELFQPRDWAAPGRQCRIICNAENCAAIHALHDATETSKVNQIKCSEGHRWVQKKTVADVVEAFIGAHLVDGGPGAALAFMHWLGIEVDFDPDLVSQASARCAGDVRVIQAVDLSKLEGVLGYTFQNKAVMVEALTHSSYDRPLDKCYQRLEFLGDAVLDYLITSHLYETFPDLPPGLLTDLRSATASNECFARVAVRNNLQHYLLHNSSYLEEHVRKFVTFIDNVSQGREPFYGWECDKGPKVLGDLVESLAGAVLVDTGFNLKKVWEVFEPLLQPIVTPGTLHLHPVRELVELCNREKFELLCETSTRGKLSLVKFTVMTGKNFIEREAAKSDKKSAKCLAAYETLEKLKILGWEHPYRTLTMTLVSQGHIGPRKAALEGSPVPEFTRSSNRMDHPSGVQPTDCESRSTTEPNIRSSAGIAEFLKIAERNSQVSEKLEKEICGKVSFFADAIRPDPSYSPDTEDFSYCSNAIEVLAYGEEDDTAGNFEGDLSLWTSSASLGQVDSFEMSSRQTSGITDLQLSHSSKLGSRQGNALPESITNGFGDDQGFYFEEITSTESKDNSIVCTSDQEDQFIAEVYKCTDGDIVVPMSRTQKSRSLQDFDVWQCPISTDKKRQPSVDISGSTPPLSSELIMRKLTEENSSHNAATSHAKDYMSVDAQDMSDTHTFSLAGKTRFEDFISRLERTSHHRAQFPESSLPKASEGPVFGGPSFSKNNHSLPDLNNPSSRSCGSIPSELPPLARIYDEYVGRPREELHNICAKNKWEMPVYAPCDVKGPPHAPRFTYIVRVKFHDRLSEYEIECEGEAMGDTKRAMDSAASQAIAYLQQEVLGRI
ncbi:endoribonuclease Dicer [Marchantia polymorpha subsp. ruderalis]|uniref:Dicer-like protein 4 n=2 Tax=Marchantia polymorpha TaxID=3197 RepID=A0AAF6BYI6_MARPO|nr:hypothetical protein MARPO_0003s0184 [Marchantia polymorpha]BBN17070.1 hypothetical protein Mp_7g11720 [Marchantia polymorpha subsp. ruderalis]|eukprot:PTQ49306.1 hypothetical protein MARPO_0003s0184 [Marchantia polymorpha]